MKLATPRSFNRPAAVKPPIELERPVNPNYTKDQIQTFKCKTDPSDSSSSQYDIAVPYFDTGTPEQWIYFQRCFRRAVNGQGDTNGPKQYKKARMLLQGEALAAFEGQVSSQGITHVETLNSFKSALAAVTESVFPKRAAQVQKRYLRRFLRKPYEMTTKNT